MEERLAFKGYDRARLRGAEKWDIAICMGGHLYDTV
jgi:hypothetical protein